MAVAQQYNNEWIKYPQTYYKFKVGSNGLYRIPKSALDAAGIGNVDVRFFELWRNGSRVPVYTTAASGPLASNGYIEFWGEANDGKPDKDLYRNAVYQHNTAKSLLTDTAVYFLSVNTDQSGFFYADPGNDVASNVLPAETYFMYKAGNYYANKINSGFAAVIGEYVYSSSYDRGEFWSSDAVRPATPLSTTLSGLPVYTGGPNATLRYGAMGDALNARTLQISVNNNLLQDTIMDYFVDVHTTIDLPLSMISSGTATVKFQNTSSVSTDRLVVSYFEINYPRLFDFSNQRSFKFSLPASGAKYLEITNFNYGSTAPVLLNLTNGQRITGDISTPGTVKFVIGAGGARDFVLVNVEASNVTEVTSLTSKTFKRYNDPANQGDYIIISNKLLFNGTHGNNPVEDYRAYRASAAGGSHSAIIVDIDELVDQFAFGIKKSPLSIKNFLKYARAYFGTTPKNVFLIGRGVTYNLYRINESNASADLINLVPTFGYPGSDNMLSSANAASPIAITSIGRLSVVHPYEIENYLEKVIEYENVQKNSPNTLAAREWMKNVMHVTGSSDPYLGTVLCNYMGVYKQIIEDTSFGAKVSSFCKTTTNTIEQINSEKIAQLFEEGISVLTYFGHSSTTTLEFNLDKPESYNNQGKYPIFFVNGCNAGNFFTFNASRLQFNETLSEKFTLAKQRGGVAFVASTHFGIVNYLNIYLNHLYAYMSKSDFGKPLGQITRDALQEMLAATGPNDYYARLHAEEITIHGDPLVMINEMGKPDYVVEESQVKINPTFVSVAENSFRVKIRIVNNGKALNDSIMVDIKRQYPDGSVESVLRKKIEGVRYADSITVDLPVIATRDKGTNKIIVIVDADMQVDEVTKDNNTVTKEVVIFEDEARVTYPYNYSVINNNKQKLYASTANALSVSKTYTMELDTTQLFNSPLKVSKTLTSIGGVLEFDPGITYQDSMVYYWRVASEPVDNRPPLWSNSSFRYIAGVNEGFAQAHYYQHTNSEIDRITLDPVTKKWKYGTRTNEIYVRNGMFGTAVSTAAELSVSVNDQTFISSACLGRSVMFNVFDPITFKPWKNVDQNGNNLYLSGSASANCAATRIYNFEFSYLTPSSRKLIMNFMDSIPNGYYVIVRSFDNNNPNSFSYTWRGDTTLFGSNNSLYHKLLGAGMMNVDSINAAKAWIFTYKKNDPDFIPKYVVSQGIYDRVSITDVVNTPDTLGRISSPVFGPAKEWKNVIWNGSSLEGANNDNPDVEIVGIDASKAETVLAVLDKNTKNFDISTVNAEQYPYMKLKMRNIDSITLTPYQLSSWMVYYTPMPEGAIAPNIFYEGKDTLEVGEPLSFGVAFKNISQHNFDSLSVKMNIVDRNNVTRSINIPKQKPLIINDTVTVKYTIDSKDYIGANTIYFDFNPNNEQPEQYQFNNFLFKNFYVKDDHINPLLDVTFDGVHILNRDIVSAKPHIQIKLKDEAKFLLLNDTALSSVQIRYPDGSLRTYHFDSDTLRFTPATAGSDNSAVIDFQPQFINQYNPEGDEYELIVKGKDRSGNKAGSEYRVAFTVITKAMISNLLNYPNPFSTSTAFVFTLTGSEIPQNMKIQILTVTGKIVREITKEELGPIRIGRNITEFKWDGTDQFGQKLANGVYLYRFVTSLNGKRMDKYKAQGDNTDKFFNNGYGKMYLMR